MAHGYVKVPSDVVKEGDEIEAQIIDFNRRKKQIKLSMKAVQPEPKAIVEEKPQPAHSGEAQSTRPRRERKAGRKPRKFSESDNAALKESLNENTEPEPTSMEFAMRAAMEKAKDRNQKQETRKAKAGSPSEQDELLGPAPWKTNPNQLDLKKPSSPDVFLYSQKVVIHFLKWIE